MTHDEYVDIIILAKFSLAELSRLIRADERRLSDSLTGERGWKPYEHSACRAIAIRSRLILSRLEEYGHGDK